MASSKPPLTAAFRLITPKPNTLWGTPGSSTVQRGEGKKSLSGDGGGAANVDVLCSDNLWHSIEATQLCPGMVIRVKKLAQSPADLLILSASGSEVLAQHEMIDGDQHVRVRVAFDWPKGGKNTGSGADRGPPTVVGDIGRGCCVSGSASAAEVDVKRVMAIPLDAQQTSAVALMIGMGFQEFIARKSLLESGWSPDLALDYAARFGKRLRKTLHEANASAAKRASAEMGADGKVVSETKIVSDRLSRLSQAISALSRKEKPTSGLKKSCVFTAATGAQVRANSMFWQRARLIMTDYVIGLVAFVGDQTKYELRGGKTGREKAERERLARKQKENKKAAEAKARRDAAARARNAPISPRLFETKTGMKWTDSFTDVADDGNCQIHCVWLGLQALLQWYPKLRSIVDTAIDEAKSHHGFRAQALQLMSRDVGYLAEIEESFRTYVERLRLAELMNLEDFFTLPELLRQRVLTVKKARDGDQKHSADAAASPPPAPEYKVWVSDYIGELKNGRVVNGRQVYAPLGASELRALSRCFDLQIQVMTKNAVLANLCAPSLDLVDPRRVGVGCTHVFRQQSRRIVRLLNIDANHYQVHLPRDPTSNNASPVTLSRSKAFHDSAYWGSQLFNSDMDDLPPI